MFSIGAVMISTEARAKPVLACGTLHTIEQGDTLFLIAQSAYSNGRLYKTIFEANRDLLPDPASIEIGDQTLIPCLDGTGPRTRREAIALGLLVEPGDLAAEAPPTASPVQVTAPPLATETPVQLAQVPALPIDELLRTPSPLVQATAFPGRSTAGPALQAPEITASIDMAPERVDNPIRLFTGSGYAPYSDENWFRGGIFTDLVRSSMRAAAPDQKTRVAFVNDWPADLGAQLRDGAFDVGFPWYKPDCTKTNQLSDELRMRCDELEFSNPIFEIAIGFYTRAGDPLTKVTSRDALIERVVCRPKGHFLFDRDQLDLMAPDVTIEIADTAADCFARLLQGQVDMVSLTRSRADAEIRDAGMSGRVAEIKSLTFRQTVHAVALKSNPNGRAYLDLINQGLADLMASGEWFEVVVRQRSERLAELN